MPEKLPPLPQGYTPIDEKLPPLPEGFTPLPPTPSAQLATEGKLAGFPEYQREQEEAGLKSAMVDLGVTVGLTAAGMPPFVKNMPVLARMGYMAGATLGAELAGNVTRDALGIPETKRSGEDIGFALVFQAGIEGLVPVAGRAVGFGQRVTEATKELYNFSRDVNVAMPAYQTGVKRALANYWVGSVFGGRFRAAARTKLLAALTKGMDDTLGQIAQAVEPHAGSFQAAQTLLLAEKNFHWIDRARYEGLFESLETADALGQLKGENPLRMVFDKKALARTSGVIQTAEELSKSGIPAVSADAKKVESFAKLFKDVSQKGAKFTPENITMMAGSDYYDDGLKDLILGMASGGKGEVNLSVRAGHHFASELKAIIRHNAGPESQGLRRVANETLDIVNGSMHDAIVKLPDGDEIWRTLEQFHRETAEGYEIFTKNIIQTVAKKSPERLVSSMRPEKLESFVAVRDALTGYPTKNLTASQGEAAWKSVKRIWLQDRLKLPMAVEAGAAAASEMPAETLLSGVRQTAQTLRQNSELVDILSKGDPATASAIQGIKEWGALLEKNKEILAKAGEHHFMVYYIIHAALSMGAGWQTYKETANIPKSVTALGAMALGPAVLTRVMYSKTAQRLFITGFENMVGNVGKGLKPKAHDFAQMVRAVEIAMEAGNIEERGQQMARGLPVPTPRPSP